MARQSAGHIKNRARKLRASAARRVCPYCGRKAAYSEDRVRRRGWSNCRWCGKTVTGRVLAGAAEGGRGGAPQCAARS